MEAVCDSEQRIPCGTGKFGSMAITDPPELSQLIRQVEGVLGAQERLRMVESTTAEIPVAAPHQAPGTFEPGSSTLDVPNEVGARSEFD
jgi:hypothetical protein